VPCLEPFIPISTSLASIREVDVSWQLSQAAAGLRAAVAVVAARLTCSSFGDLVVLHHVCVLDPGTGPHRLPTLLFSLFLGFLLSPDFQSTKAFPFINRS